MRYDRARKADRWETSGADGMDLDFERQVDKMQESRCWCLSQGDHFQAIQQI